ncbi:MAG: hypothetical protein JJV92_10270 [Desulfosarcina sp.]|nr:hypothetical protein [Desulfobacterales bacterium]
MEHQTPIAAVGVSGIFSGAEDRRFESCRAYHITETTKGSQNFRLR